MKVIDNFRGEFFFLSNFYPCKMTILGLEFKTSEAAYQAMKACDMSDACLIAAEPTPGGTKKRGNTIEIRPDWDDIKLDVMDFVLRMKFKNKALREKLVATDNAMLIEGNTWGDIVWGQVDGVGKNYLGKLLMRLRQEFIEEDAIGQRELGA